MKSIKTLLLPMLMFLLVSTGAYAIVEVGGYGGFLRGRHTTYRPERETNKAEGIQYGGHAHLTLSNSSFQLGAGLFHNSSVFDAYKDGRNQDIIRRSTGFSTALQISVPDTDLTMYGKGGFSFYDHYILKPETGNRRTKGRLFSTSMIGAGLAFELYGPFWLFTEYMFLNGKYDNSDREFFRTHSLNLGVKLSV